MPYEELYRAYAPEPSDVKWACRTLRRLDAQPRASGASAQDCADRAKAELILRWLEIFVMAFNPDQPRDERGRWTSGGAGADSGGAQPKADGPLPNAVKYLEEHAGKKSQGRCAMRVREALEQDGIYIGQHGSAENYGDVLEEHGFEKVVSDEQGQVYPPNGEAYPPLDYSATAGDEVVIQYVPRHSDGHMAMYSAKEKKWLSDFKQEDFWPHRDYRKANPRYAIYRLKK